MYNAWSRSTLRIPGGLEVDFVCAPPYHSSGFTSALLVICSGRPQRKAFILNVAVVEPQIATSIDIPSSQDKVLDVSWGPEGTFYLLRSVDSQSWRIEPYRLEMHSNGEGPSWSIKPLPS